MVRRVAPVLVLSLLCCQPAVVEQGESSGTLSEPDGGGSGDQVQQQGGPPVFTEAPAPGSCPASKLREVRYGGTVGQGVKLSNDIAGRRCVEDPRSKIEDELACVRDYNQASWGHALYELGLTLIEAEMVGFAGEDRYRGNLAPGVVLDVAAASEDPEAPQGPSRVVFAGFDGYDCSGTSVLTATSPGVSLATNQAGEIVVVVPKPTVEGRSYVACSCFPGCGAYMEPMPRFIAVPEGARLGQAVELVYPAISIAVSSVESTSCCCAP